MTTKEMILREVESARDEDLEELYELVRRFNNTRTQPPNEEGALVRLLRIRIDAPADFSANLDQYVSGEKSLATGSDAD